MLLLAAIASAAASYHVAQPARVSALLRSHSPAMEVRKLGGLDEFDEQMGACVDDVKAVKFVADRCRGCQALKPKFESLAKSKASKAQFFEVSFKGARDLFDREGIKRTPTVLYYLGGVGRVGGFAFGPKVDRNLLQQEVRVPGSNHRLVGPDVGPDPASILSDSSTRCCAVPIAYAR